MRKNYSFDTFCLFRFFLDIYKMVTLLYCIFRSYDFGNKGFKYLKDQPSIKGLYNDVMYLELWGECYSSRCKEK